MRDSANPIYKKGFSRGRALTEREQDEARRRFEREVNAHRDRWEATFNAVLGALINSSIPWKNNGETVTTTGQYAELAVQIANAATAAKKKARI